MRCSMNPQKCCSRFRLCLQTVRKFFYLFELGQGGRCSDVSHFERTGCHRPAQAVLQVKALQQSVKQTGTECISCAGCIDRGGRGGLDGKPVPLCIEGMDLVRTISGDDNPFGNRLQPARMLAHIHTREILPDIWTGVGGDARVGQRRMIGPDHVAYGSGNARLISQSRSRQALRSAI